MKLPNSSRRSALSKAMAFAMSYLLLWGSVPAPALAEAVEELDGNEQSSAELVVTNDEGNETTIGDQSAPTNEEETKVSVLASQLREQLAEDAAQEDFLAAAFHALADAVTIDDELELEEDEAIDAALAGEATTTVGLAKAFVALAEELGLTAELVQEEEGTSVTRVQIGEEWLEIDIAQAVRDRVENNLTVAPEPWAAQEERQEKEEKKEETTSPEEGEDKQTNETIEPAAGEQQQEEGDTPNGQVSDVETKTAGDGEQEEKVEYIYEQIDSANFTTFMASDAELALTAQEDATIASTTSNVTTYAPYEQDSVRSSYLYVNADGNLVRVEYSESQKALFVQKLRPSLVEPYAPSIIAKNTYMPTGGSDSTLQWGGFYAGANAFFVVTGLSNSAKNESTIVYRISKYNKDWTYQGAAEFRDNLAAIPKDLQEGASLGAIHYGTVVPFSESGVSMNEVGTSLHVRTAHQNFAGHQTNVHLELNESNMQLTGSMTYTANQGDTTYGYVSHSFAQRLALYNNKLYALDLGDASPRALTVKRIGATGDSSYSNVLVIGGAKGVNYTGVTVGGFEASSAGLMSAYASINQNAFTGKGDFSPRNVYVAVTPANPDPGAPSINKLSDYADAGTTGGDLVKLVKISDDSFLVMWAEMNTDSAASWTEINQKGEVCYVFVDANGNKTSNILRGHGYLSDCDPVLENGRVVWYAEDVYGNHGAIYYEINLSTKVMSSPQVRGNMQDIANVTIPDQEFTGAAITPTFGVVLNGTTLVEGEAYELVYKNNTNVGEATVTVRGIADNGYTSSKTFSFSIIKATPRVVPQNSELGLIVGGGTGKVTAKVYTSDTSTNTLAKSYGSITYTSSNTSIATVTTGGVVKPVAAGNCNITITTTGNNNWNPAPAVIVPVTVLAHKGTPTITVPDSIELEMGETDKKVGAEATPGAGAITYTSADKNTVAVGSTTGALTPKKVGTTTITVKSAESEVYQAATATVPVTVTKGTPTITVPEHKTLIVGGSTASIGATFSPSSGIGTKTYTSSDTSVVTVSSSGVLTAKGAGTATITVAVADSANYNAAQATVAVTVAKGEPTITASDKSLEVGDEVKLSATTSPTTLKSSLTYASSNEQVATIDETGLITATGAGRAIITVALPETEDYTATSKDITIEVAKGTPSLVAYNTTVAMGDTSVVDAYFSTGEGNLSYTVTGDPTVATVDSEGNVTPLKVGSTEVTVSFAGDDNWEPATATATITVTKGTPLITAMDASVGMNSTSRVIAKITPNAGDLTYTSKNTGIVTVDAHTGALTPVKVGYTTITVAFAGNDNWKAVSETVGVTVSGSTATVTASDLTLKLSDAPKQIQAEVDPVDAGALVYMIEDESVATVDGEGYVTPVKAGNTKATVMSVASDEYASGIAEITITVQKGTPTLNVSPVNVAMGTTGQLTVTGPEGVNSFTYSSADTSIVEVDSTGKLTPKKAGGTTVTITSAATNNWEQGTATANVTVTKGTPTITADDITIPVGDTDESVVANTNGGTLSFESKNTAVVTVDSDGKLTPIETGTAQIEITAASNDDWNAGTKTITVTVVTGKPTITAENVTVAMGKTAAVAATVNKGAGDLSYTSNNTNVVTVNSTTGALTPVHAGTTTVTISCAESTHWEAATKDITVTVQKGTPTITASNVTVAMGAEATITASASDGAGALLYTSQTTTVAKVEEATGKVTPVKVGTANILVASAATDDWAEGTAIVKVEVTKGTPTITVANTSVGIGKTASLGAKLNDGAVSGTLTYTSRNDNVVTVSTSGVLTGVAVGTAAVQIAFNGNTNWNAVTKEVTVTVTPGAATITAEDVSLAMGTTKTITAHAEGGGALSYESKNTAVVTVDSGGNLTPVKVGTAKVDITSAETSTHGAGSKTITVTVTKGTPTVTANDVTVTMGGTATITPTASSGTTSFTFTSANTGIATVSSSGVVTPKAGGSTTITVTSKSDTNWNSASKDITVTVNRGTPTISAGNKSVNMGSTVSLGATTNGGPLSYKSSKESVATVSATGVVTPKGAGTAIITITSAETPSWASVSKTVTVTVLKATPTISMSNKTVVMGKTVSMGATVSKGGGGITYESSNKNIATVNANGVVTPVSAGTVTITAVSDPTAGYQSARKTATVTVTEGVPVITAANLTFVYGTKGKKVTATVTSGAKPTYTSTKPAVVTVNASTGELTAVKAGTAYITISAPAVSGKWKAVAKKIRVKITKAPQTITSKTKDITVSYSTTAQTPDAAAVTGTAPGKKISYTRSAGSSKIKINKTTGKITVAKKTKKGKYTITAKITAKATPQYKKATKKVTFTVTVK